MIEKLKKNNSVTGLVISGLMGMVCALVIGVSTYAFYRLDDLQESIEDKADKTEVCAVEQRLVVLNDKLRAELALAITRVESDLKEIKEMVRDINRDHKMDQRQIDKGVIRNE